jgi:hypothetical protein
MKTNFAIFSVFFAFFRKKGQEENKKELRTSYSMPGARLNFFSKKIAGFFISPHASLLLTNETLVSFSNHCFLPKKLPKQLLIVEYI